MRYISLILVLFLLSCSSRNWKHVEIVSPDKNHTITLITKGDFRYVIPGKQQEIPVDNFAKFDISKVDAIGDEICICWHENGWEFTSLYSELLENRIKDNKKTVKSILGNDINEHYEKSCRASNCVSIMIRENSLDPHEAGSINYK